MRAWGLGAFSPGVKRQGREAGHPPQTRVSRSRIAELYLHSIMRLHIVVIIIIITYLNCKWVYPVAVVLQEDTKLHISHKITHHAQTKHSTQSYTNNKGHITHDEYNAIESKTILVTGRGGLQGCVMLRIAHCLDSRLTDGGKVVSLMHRPRFTPERSSGTHFC
jgi:hypothetical protein